APPPPPPAPDAAPAPVAPPGSERGGHRVTRALVARRADDALGLTPGDVDPDARMIVELLRVRLRPRPVDGAEARAALEASCCRRRAPHQRPLEPDRDRSQRQPPYRTWYGAAAWPEAEKPLLLAVAVQMHDAIARAAATVVGDNGDAP